MRNNVKLEEYVYADCLAKPCAEHVAEKRSLGIMFNVEARRLREIAREAAAFGVPENTMPEAFVKQWLCRRGNEADKNLYARFASIKGLAEYMHRMGYSAYQPQKNEIPKLRLRSYLPHIFSYAEVKLFFETINAMNITNGAYSARRQEMLKQIFRLLYCCGLRVSEACALKADDIDWLEKVILIRQTKFNKQRYIPISDEIVENLRKYIENNPHEPYLFINRNGEPFATTAIYNAFREIISMSGIEHRGRGEGPRLHDWRHTFAVHCLQKWVMGGVSLSSALPRLSTYLGHKDMSATEGYLRLTAQMFPEISGKMSEAYGYLVPKECDIVEDDF